jgi:flagellar motor switch protein FliN/FliY
MNQSDIDALTNAAGQVQSPSFSPQLTEFGPGPSGTSEVPLELLMDLTLPLSIELGRTRMTVQDILRLGRGSVVQLERLAGEPIDLYVADRRFAEGEVVVLGEHFGVRITRIIANVVGAEVNA